MSFFRRLCFLLITPWLLTEVYVSRIYYHSPIFTNPSSSHFKIIVSVAAYWTPGRPLEYLFRLLDEYERAFAVVYDVHVCVDTNSKELFSILSNRRPTQSTREVRVWSLEELEGNPENLPRMHRQYWEERKNEFDFFIFTEDDILFSLEAFNMYITHRLALQDKGWTYGFLRVETWGIDNKTLVALDTTESRADMTVFETPDGQLWAEPWSPYTAHYVLDQYELRIMIDDISNVWSLGFPSIDNREKIALGYNYKFSGSQFSNPFGARGWQSRALVPISSDCKVKQPQGFVRHLPSKYAKSTSLITNNDCIEGGPRRWGLGSKWGPDSLFGSGSNVDCRFGRIPLSRVFLCDKIKPIPLPIWPEGAKLN
jgi:hypothetical protein